MPWHRCLENCHFKMPMEGKTPTNSAILVMEELKREWANSLNPRNSQNSSKSYQYRFVCKKWNWVAEILQSWLVWNSFNERKERITKSNICPYKKPFKLFRGAIFTHSGIISSDFMMLLKHSCSFFHSLSHITKDLTLTTNDPIVSAETATGITARFRLLL